VLDTLTSISDIDSVVINTDARDILIENGLMESKKIIIRDRRKEICGDFTSMNLVIEDDVKNIDADIYLMTHTTNPFLSKKSIQDAIKKFEDALDKKLADSLFSVNKSQERFYYQNGLPINHDPTNLIRTQDIEPWFIENSNLYLFTRESFYKTHARIGLKPIMLETPLYESTDIDTPDDWDLAEVMIEYYKKKGILNEV
jgi:CMP-N-acetylneuraminic acid synthetase